MQDVYHCCCALCFCSARLALSDALVPQAGWVRAAVLCECVGLPVLPHKLDGRVEASEMIESGLVCTAKQAYTLSDNGKDAV